MVATRPRTSSRAAVNSQRRSARTAAWVVTNALALVTFAVGCTGIRLYGCMRLDGAATTRAAAQAALTSTERANFRLMAVRDGLIHPDRLAKIAEGSGMMPVSPSLFVECPLPSRMAKAADIPNVAGNGY